MKKALVFVVALLVSGCSYRINGAEMLRAQSICSNKGGVVEILTGRKVVQCYDLKYYDIDG